MINASLTTIMLKNEYILSKMIFILRMMVGLIFLFSAITKFIDIETFAIAVSNFKLLNVNWIPIFKYLIPSIEFLLGFLLIINYKSIIVSQIITGVICLFTAIIVAKIFEGEDRLVVDSVLSQTDVL